MSEVLILFWQKNLQEIKVSKFSRILSYPSFKYDKSKKSYAHIIFFYWVLANGIRKTDKW